MNVIEIIASLVISIIGGFIVIYIQDNWLRNKRKEKAYIFRHKLFYVKEDNYEFSTQDKRENNRKLVKQFFFIIFGIYLLWVVLYFPLVVKASLFQETVNLSKSNLSSFFAYINLPLESYIFELSLFKWYCLSGAIFLLVPSLFFASKMALLFSNAKNQFYAITEVDLNLHRLYGFISFIALVLSINIYVIFTNSFFYSLGIGIMIIILFLLKANER